MTAPELVDSRGEISKSSKSQSKYAHAAVLARRAMEPPRMHRGKNPPSRRAYILPEWVTERELNKIALRREVPVDKEDVNRLVVVQFNIMAQSYVKERQKWTAWPSRRALILKEVVGTKGKGRGSTDIVCMQEVDRFEDLAKGFRKDGYEGVFGAKTQGKPDGVATFWAQGKFHLLGMKIAPLNVDAGPSTGQVAMFTILHDTGNGGCVCVVNTHLKSDRGGGKEHVRVAQLEVMLHELVRYLETTYDEVGVWRGGLSGGKGKGTPTPKVVEAAGAHLDRTALLICGDFNSHPRDSCYELLSTGTCSRSSRSHNVPSQLWDRYGPFRSAYADYQTLSGQFADGFFEEVSVGKREPLYTYRASLKGKTLDYIFYSLYSGLTPQAILKIPGSKELLPRADYPSDHYSIKASMLWV